jgi:ATP-dependent exoDNAse (exonuclease V) beta subunit
MTKPLRKQLDDAAQRVLAVDAERSVLVQAPAGSGKTTLLVDRFLALLARVNEPGEIVAITFTKAAATEMRHRILEELEKAEFDLNGQASEKPASEFAKAAYRHSLAMDWKLLDQPAQLRITTIDSFCRQLALQQPLLSGVSADLQIDDNPEELYRNAARRTLSELAGNDDKLRGALRQLLEWKDNNWRALEDELVRMLGVRDKWLQPFLLNAQVSEAELRDYLEKPFQNAIRRGVENSVEPENLPQAHYADEEWRILYACFTVLRQAAVELKVLFAEAGRVDFAEVAALAQNVLDQNAGATAEAGFAVAEGIRHLLVDEFQDTSRVQYRLLGSIVSEWSEHEGRSVFVVGDPMQSIYFFRNAEAELFHRTRELGLTLPDGEPYELELAQLRSNFRTQPELVERLNGVFAKIKESSGGADESDQFVAAEPARDGPALIQGDGLHLRFDYMRSTRAGKPIEKKAAKAAAKALHQKHIDEIVELCRNYRTQIDAARDNGSKFRIAILGRTKKVLAPIAAALSEAGISYRAADTEELSARAEVMDALALARALMNPEDRVNWLGVLRAPWCGLPLNDLFTLVSADDPDVQSVTIPKLLVERVSLLTPASQAAVQRVIEATTYANEFRVQNPAAALGTWLEAVWLKLGGAACVTAAERVNLDLLWSSLDKLTLGEAGLLGPNLDAVLEKLKARPDPNSSSQFGVQLMTLHKSKGLEFEVVIVPELQAGTSKGNRDMLAWLERGTLEESEQPSEFLVAVKQPKGGERSNNKEWVDGVVRERERRELNRLFYVAATRAREALHLFARIEYKIVKGAMELNIPSDTLLETAYKGLSDKIDSDFARWVRTQISQSNAATVQLAAAGNVLIMPTNASGRRVPTLNARLRHLPSDFVTTTSPGYSVAVPGVPLRTELYQRQRGGLESRLLGRTIHTLLESITKARATAEWPEALNVVSKQRPQLVAGMRAQGCSIADANALLQKAELAVQTAVESPIGRWVLDPHPFAASESKWTGIIGRELRQLRPDRLFQAGDAPLTLAQSSPAPQWWIIDYKSAHLAAQFTEQELVEQRRLYAPQLELYGRFLRELEGEEFAINLGLFYPAAAQFDHWKINFSHLDEV